ncbi:hypothetical protein [Halobacterium zhouii]|uniref:hypothetical protein n=1 Tax=Halobacterium zhouii TaxID=2902624 RepID=UPI001E2DBFC5|nr:hypothetical protein [Halobacterium zhouii]
MKRRALLGTLATTAFAGCTSVLGDSANTTDDPTTTDEPTDSPETTEPTTEDEFFSYHIDDVQTDDAPVADVTIDVTVEQQFALEHPAVLRVAFTNDADEAREFQFGSLVPWDELWGTHEDDTSELLLAPGTSVVPDEPEDDCWRATDGVALPMVMKSETLDPGETRIHDFRVLATHDSENCFQSGTYRFEDEGYLGEGWGFSVHVVPIVE